MQQQPRPTKESRQPPDEPVRASVGERWPGDLMPVPTTCCAARTRQGNRFRRRPSAHPRNGIVTVRHPCNELITCYATFFLSMPEGKWQFVRLDYRDKLIPSALKVDSPGSCSAGTDGRV